VDLETYTENLSYKHGYSHGLVYDAMIFERNKIMRRDYTFCERHFQGKRQEIKKGATEQAFNILDRYYRQRANSKKMFLF
jgi:hypothetical protein